MTPATFAHLDDALREASVMCHSSGDKRAVIYCSTHKDVADPASGEKYIVFHSSTPMRHHLKPEQEWRAVYTVTVGDL